MTAVFEEDLWAGWEADVAAVEPHQNGVPDDDAALLAKRIAWHRADAKAKQVLAEEGAVQVAVDATEEQAQHRKVAVEALRGKLLDRQGLRDMPPTRYLIKGVLDYDSESWLIGASGGFKSFVAVDWACHVSTGRTWWGRRIRQGRVLYVVAEGAKAFGKRIEAWEIEHKLDVTDVVVLPMPVQARAAGPKDAVSYDWGTLCHLAAEERFDLVILDTQARMTVGLEENSNTAMGVWIEAVRMLREATGACILVVHHTGRNGGDARGASALDGAQDAEWKVTRSGPKAQRAARLMCEKSKDGDDDQVFDFQANVVELGEDEDGDPITSLVLRRISDALAAHLREQAQAEEFAGYDHDVNLTDNQKDVMAVLKDVVDHRGASKAVLLRIVNERRAERAKGTDTDFKKLVRGSLDRAVEALEKLNMIVALDDNGNRWVDATKLGEDAGETVADAT